MLYSFSFRGTIFILCIHVIHVALNTLDITGHWDLKWHFDQRYALPAAINTQQIKIHPKYLGQQFWHMTYLYMKKWY